MSEREKAISIARDNWLAAIEKTCPQVAEVKKAEYQRLTAEIPQETEIWKTEYERFVTLMQAQNQRLAALIEMQAKYQHRPTLAQAPDWTSKPTYSKWVHDYTGAETPFEQFGVYATFLGGILYARRSWVRSGHLMQATQLPVGCEERKMHEAMGWLTEIEIKYPAYFANKIRTRGIFAGIGIPFLWLAYIENKKK